MKILVTGSNGFVGRQVCRVLVQAGHEVVGVVRSPEAAKIVSESGAQPCLVESFESENIWNEIFSSIDGVIHLAARVHVMNDHAGDPLNEFRKTNVEMTSRLAEACARAGVRKFIYVSSVKAAGEGSASAYREDQHSNPQDPYGVSKYEAEMALQEISKRTGLQVVILRPPLIYGAGVKANFLQLMKIVRKGIPLPFGWVKNRRSLVYIGNLADAIRISLFDSRANGKTFYVSDGQDFSTRDLICSMAKGFGKSPRLIPFPVFLMRTVAFCIGKRAVADRLIGSLVVDSSAIRRELDWNPPFTVDQGIGETVKWYQSTL